MLIGLAISWVGLVEVVQEGRVEVVLELGGKEVISIMSRPDDIG